MSFSSASTRVRTVVFPAPEGPETTIRFENLLLNVLHLLARRARSRSSARPPPAPWPRTTALLPIVLASRASSWARKSSRFPQGASAPSSPRAWATWLRSRCSSSATSWRSTRRTTSWYSRASSRPSSPAQLARPRQEGVALLGLPRGRQRLDARGRRLHRVAGPPQVGLEVRPLRAAHPVQARPAPAAGTRRCRAWPPRARTRRRPGPRPRRGSAPRRPPRPRPRARAPPGSRAGRARAPRSRGRGATTTSALSSVSAARTETSTLPRCRRPCSAARSSGSSACRRRGRCTVRSR